LSDLRGTVVVVVALVGTAALMVVVVVGVLVAAGVVAAALLLVQRYGGRDLSRLIGFAADDPARVCGGGGGVNNRAGQAGVTCLQYPVLTQRRRRWTSARQPW